MKRIRRSRAARLASWLLTVAMITSIATGTFSPHRALAQSAASTGSNTVDVVVIKFANKTGMLGDSLAADASSQVANELSAAGRYTPLPDRDVENAIKARGLRAPYDTIALSKIAADLNVTTVVTGEIVWAKVQVPKNGTRVVRVALQVRLIEASTGDLLNGASQVGMAQARPGVMDTDSLVREATNNAAVQAVKEILSFSLPIGTVIQTGAHEIGALGATCLINRGTRDGVKAGMRMIVLRDRQRVATIEVTNVFDADADAKILESTLGVRPEDKVRAVFPMPPIPTEAGIRSPSRQGGNPMSRLGRILGVLLVGAVIVAAVSGGKNASVTGVTAEATTQQGAPSVRVTWRDNIWGSGGTRQYLIWRPQDVIPVQGATPIAAVDKGLTTYFDVPSPLMFWDGARGYLQVQTGTNNNNNNNNGGSTATLVVPATTAVGTPKGFIVGRTVQYGISAVVTQTVPDSGGTNNNNGGGTGGGNGIGTTQDVGTDMVVSGFVTPVNPAILQSPTNQSLSTDISLFNPAWLSTAGANVFEVEVTTDPSFTQQSLIFQFPLVISTSTNVSGVQQQFNAPVSLRGNTALRRDPTFKAFDDGTSSNKPTLYWRVGARNDSDRPGPVDVMSNNPGSGNRTWRFVYSTVRSFKPADLPPPPP